MTAAGLRGPVAPLVVIESFGKIQALRRAFKPIADELWGGSLPWIVATMGHLMASPRDLSIVGVDADGIEHMREPRKQERIDAILSAAAGRSEVIMMTDADDEGEVIATDAARSLLQSGYDGRILRARLSSIDTPGLRNALDGMQTLDPSDAFLGYARSAFDRLVGATYSSRHRSTGRGIAVGRVLTALLGTARDGRIPAGEVTIRRRAESGPDFVGTVHVPDLETAKKIMARADEWQTKVFDHSPRQSPLPTMAVAVDAIRRETGAGHPEIMSTLQELYQDGLVSYPRTDSTWVPQQTRERLCIMMGLPQIAVPVDEEEEHWEGAHQALHPTAPAPLEAETGADLRRKCHSIVYRLAYHAMAAPNLEVEYLQVEGVEKIEVIALSRSMTPDGKASPVQRLADRSIGYRAYDPTEAIFVTLSRGPCLDETPWSRMMLGAPSTWIDHAVRFTALDLIDDEMRLTAKGRSWCSLSPKPLLEIDLARELQDSLIDEMPASVIEDATGEGHFSNLTLAHVDRATLISGKVLVSMLKTWITSEIPHELRAAMDPRSDRTLAMLNSVAASAMQAPESRSDADARLRPRRWSRW